MIEPTATFELIRDVRFRQVAGEGLVLRQSDGEIIGVNELGVLVLQELQRGQSFDDIVASICDSFEVDRDQARQDLASYLDALRDSGVITYRG